MLPKRNVNKITRLERDVDSVDLGVEDVEVEQVIDKIVPNEKSQDYDDIKGIMKDINLFKSNKLSGIKVNIGNLKTELKLVGNLNKLLGLVKDKLSPDEMMGVCLQIIEDTVHISDKKDCNVMKLKIAKEVLKPIIVCSEPVLDHLISLTCKGLKKSTFLRRNKHRIYRLLKFFFAKL